MTAAADRVAARQTGGGAARKSSTPSTAASARRPARPAAVEHLSRADRAARGKDARVVAPLESQGEFSPRRGRDPSGCFWSGTVAGAGAGAGPARADAGFPFTFYRAATLPMAGGPGLEARLGAADAPMWRRPPVEFGAFDAAERRLVFTSTTSTRRCPGRSGSSSGWPLACRDRAGRGLPAKAGEHRPGGGRTLPHRDARVRGPGLPGRQDRAPGDCAGLVEFRSQMLSRKGSARRDDAGQGPHRRQHAGAGQADHHVRLAAAIIRASPMMSRSRRSSPSVQADAIYRA